MKKIKSYIMMLGRKYQQKMMFVIEKKSNDLIEVRTDGMLYELIYDPSTSDIPHLMKESAEEFGFEYKAPNVYQKQENFRTMLQKNGWDMELEGGGIIHVYRER